MSFLLSFVFFPPDAVPPRTILPYQPTDELSPYIASTSSSSSSLSSSSFSSSSSSSSSSSFLSSLVWFLSRGPFQARKLFLFSLSPSRPTDCIQIISRMPRDVPVRSQFVLVAAGPKVIFTLEFPEFSILFPSVPFPSKRPSKAECNLG